MCNPRRIRERATRQVSEAWRAAIERTARLNGTATGRAELSQPLGTMLGASARRAFEAAIASDSSWERRDDAYYMAVPGGEACYRPGSGNLEISVELSAYVEAEGSATEVVEGTIEETVEAYAEGQYYDDGYGGFTRERAQREALDTAAAEAERQARDRAEAARRTAAQRSAAAQAVGGDRAQREAEAQARARFTAEHERRGEQLTGEAQALLDRVHEDSMRGVWATVAIGYRNALLEYARRHGGRDIDVTQVGNTMQVQFRMAASA
jgi:hypothetical protein